MKLLLEADFALGEIRFARENEDGFIVSQFPIGVIQTPDAEIVLKKSEDIAEAFGWSKVEDWNNAEDGVVMWAYVEPAPTKVSFVGTEKVSNETAISYAEMAGFKVKEILNQELVTDEGKVVVTLAPLEPLRWNYDDFIANEPFGE